MNRVYVAVVTDASKGIGFQVSRKLCAWFDEENVVHQQYVDKQPQESAAVYVCFQDLSQGRLAMTELESEYADIPRLLQLDVTNDASIRRAFKIIEEGHAVIDILVLNATMKSHDFKTTFDVNYFGTRKTLQAFLPLMDPAGRIVVIAATESQDALEAPAGDTLQSDMTLEQLDSLAYRMIELSKTEGALEKAGFHPCAYANSKLLVRKLTEMEARRLRDTQPRLLINCCSPGAYNAGFEEKDFYRTAESGVSTPFMLSTLPSQSMMSGKYFEEGREGRQLSM
eukprot:Protomagalhaensia_sp_Gyna_25__162@NODE_1078_length_2219_cov_166_643119_g471_i1_p1_GENE_NODE_1078_length_2219_cov_166_643119_g471_i1NODE_1078_length_2219_cov_166_643119_g471_i1_p1_ORF_typecomplete_len283_score46_77adh_short/PF00106_25/6_9e25adh_short_C2/PF13561_6/2_6e163Beta_HSD/PF01073_19/0_0087Epimerase/PF01370_21/0_0094KR/PF08659_10/0_031ILEI/PF15711_5/0_18_NODE_1078_length_2219_cov_166_643119_g471_i16791527